MNHRNILISGAVFMALGVLFGAFGAHALKMHLSPDLMEVYKTGVEYQFYHALGLMLIGLIGFHLKSKWLNRAGLFIFAGIVLFSGSLYLLALTDMKWIGAITPFGGIAFVFGWISLAVGILKN